MRRKRRQQKAQPRFTNNNIALLGLGVLAAIGLVQYLSPSAQQHRQLKADARLNDFKLQAESAVGNDRYRRNCIMSYAGVPDANGYYHEVLPLSEGMIIVSAHDGRPLTDGQIVCDHLFMTYEIVDGKTANPARATDSAIVIKRFNEFSGWHPDARRGATIKANNHDKN